MEYSKRQSGLEACLGLEVDSKVAGHLVRLNDMPGVDSHRKEVDTLGEEADTLGEKESRCVLLLLVLVFVVASRSCRPFLGKHHQPVAQINKFALPMV